MNYRIVCTEQQPGNLQPSQAHIVAVGIGTEATRATERMTLAEVIAAIDVGHVFYTQGERTGKIARVHKEWCPTRRHYIIKSAPDAVTDNNLDHLRYCAWKR